MRALVRRRVQHARGARESAEVEDEGPEQVALDHEEGGAREREEGGGGTG